MFRKVSIIVICVLCSLGCIAQEKSNANNVYKRSAVVKSVKENLKSKAFDKADKELTAAFAKYPETQNDKQLLNYKVTALYELALGENRKIYLNTKPDTAKYFSYITSMYDYAMRCDSVDALPDSKGKVRISYRSGIADKLMTLRKNLAAGSRFFYKKKEYAKSLAAACNYIQSKTHDVLTQGKYASAVGSENDLTEISTIATLSAYSLGRHADVIKYVQSAKQDTAHLVQLLEIQCRSYSALNDTVLFRHSLYEGFEADHTYEFFYMTLFRHYIDGTRDVAKLDSAFAVTDAMLAKGDSSRICWYIRGKILVDKSHYTEAQKCFLKAIEKQQDDAESYSAIADIYLHEAKQADLKFNIPVTHRNYYREKKKIDAIYVKAAENYELARRYSPKDSQLWLNGLKEVYFRLNKGNELKQLERVKVAK